jgi:hypothetical protein
LSYFDACLIAERCREIPAEQVAGYSGALLYGTQSAEQRGLLDRAVPGKMWRHTASLTFLIGPSDNRFPQTNPDAIDFRFPHAELKWSLQQPGHIWFAALNPQNPYRTYRFNLPPGTEMLAGIRRLAARFPNALFVVDPFQNGPQAAWKAQVRLAECTNIFLTTLGLVPGSACRWDAQSPVEEAIYYTTGEVGAGKLLLASGQNTEMLSAQNSVAWLEKISVLDSGQRTLIAEGNARTLFETRNVKKNN